MAAASLIRVCERLTNVCKSAHMNHSMYLIAARETSISALHINKSYINQSVVSGSREPLTDHQDVAPVSGPAAMFPAALSDSGWACSSTRRLPGGRLSEPVY